MVGRDPGRDKAIIDTNQYIVIQNNKALLIDPGGLEVFPAFISALTQVVDLENVESIFASHQDPDIISSLSLWVSVLNANVKVHLPWIWETFVAHYGGAHTLKPLPDEGGSFPLGDSQDIQLIPAHYCHSSGNFSLFDPTADILFSGDLGAAVLESDTHEVFVSDFKKHIPLMEGFHKRWMPSNKAKNRWVQRVRALNPGMICPQHGVIFKGDDTIRFLDWLEGLEVGVAV